MTWPVITASGHEQANASSSAYESFVGVHHVYIIIGLVVPCIFLIAFGAYISHFQGRCDGALRIFCPCLPTIWETRRPPPQQREMDAIVVLSTVSARSPNPNWYKKKYMMERERACVVVMPDKSCQVAFAQDIDSGRRIEGAALRPPILHQTFGSPVTLLQATVAESPSPNSSLSNSNKQQPLPLVSPKDGIESLSQQNQ